MATIQFVGEPPDRQVKTQVLTDRGPMRLSGGFAPYHFLVLGEIYVFKVSYEVVARFMLWPDHSIDFAPGKDGLPSADENVMVTRLTAGTKVSVQARERITAATWQAAEQVPPLFVRQSNQVWIQNAGHGIVRRIEMLRGQIRNLERDLTLYTGGQRYI